MSESFDLIVLGGGRAANLAIATANEGWKTALVERDLLGGVCPNRGCVPSKLLIGFADAARHVREADRHFVDAEFKGIDLGKMFDSVNEYIGGVDGRYEGRGAAAGVTLIRGEGKFTGPGLVEAAGKVLEAGKIVIATGSRPAPPPFPHLPVWTSDDLFPLKDGVPKSILIIGGGVIGCELASFFAAIGIETSLFVRKERLLGKEDAEIEQVFQKEFRKSVQTHFHSELETLEHDGSSFTAVFTTMGKQKTFHAERVLFAIGRVPNSDMLDLEKAGVATDDKGFVKVDENLATNVPGIFATGDVNGRHMLQHAAAAEVYYLRKKFLRGEKGTIREYPVGHAVFSHPEVAAVGLTEEELKETGTPYLSIVEDWLASARVMAMRIEYPRTKLLVSTDDYSILGCHLVGPEASTLIHQVITVMKLKNDVRELAETIYVHPALNECLLAAAVKAVQAVEKAK